MHLGGNFQYVICSHWLEFPEREISPASFAFLYILLLLTWDMKMMLRNQQPSCEHEATSRMESKPVRQTAGQEDTKSLGCHGPNRTALNCLSPGKQTSALSKQEHSFEVTHCIFQSQGNNGCKLFYSVIIVVTLQQSRAADSHYLWAVSC